MNVYCVAYIDHDYDSIEDTTVDTCVIEFSAFPFGPFSRKYSIEQCIGSLNFVPNFRLDRLEIRNFHEGIRRLPSFWLDRLPQENFIEFLRMLALPCFSSISSFHVIMQKSDQVQNLNRLDTRIVSILEALPETLKDIHLENFDCAMERTVIMLRDNFQCLDSLVIVGTAPDIVGNPFDGQAHYVTNLLRRMSTENDFECGVPQTTLDLLAELVLAHSQVLRRCHIHGLMLRVGEEPDWNSLGAAMGSPILCDVYIMGHKLLVMHPYPSHPPGVIIDRNPDDALLTMMNFGSHATYALKYLECHYGYTLSDIQLTVNRNRQMSVGSRRGLTPDHFNIALVLSAGRISVAYWLLRQQAEFLATVAMNKAVTSRVLTRREALSQEPNRLTSRTNSNQVQLFYYCDEYEVAVATGSSEDGMGTPATPEELKELLREPRHMYKNKFTFVFDRGAPALIGNGFLVDITKHQFDSFCSLLSIPPLNHVQEICLGYRMSARWMRERGGVSDAEDTRWAELISWFPRDLRRLELTGVDGFIIKTLEAIRCRFGSLEDLVLEGAAQEYGAEGEWQEEVGLAELDGIFDPPSVVGLPIEKTGIPRVCFSRLARIMMKNRGTLRKLVLHKIVVRGEGTGCLQPVARAAAACHSLTRCTVTKFYYLRAQFGPPLDDDQFGRDHRDPFGQRKGTDQELSLLKHGIQVSRLKARHFNAFPEGTPIPWLVWGTALTSAAAYTGAGSVPLQAWILEFLQSRLENERLANARLDNVPARQMPTRFWLRLFWCAWNCGRDDLRYWLLRHHYPGDSTVLPMVLFQENNPMSLDL